MQPHDSSRGESGQALLLLIVAMSIFLLGVLGLAIDGSQIYAQWQMAQTAADSAAQAGIMSISNGTNATAANPFATGSPAASFTCTTTDGRAPCAYARLNGFGGTAIDTVTVSFPSTVSGVTLSAATTPAITVVVQRNVQGSFIKMLGASVTTVKARATAGIVGGVSSSCVYSLDPSGSGAFSATNGATLSMGCGVEVKSSSGSGGNVQGGATVTAPEINGRFKVSNGGSISPAASGVASTISDPYAAIPAPAVASSCDAAHTNYSKGYGSWTLTPGTYCGGISFSNSANVTINPGMYVIKGGSLNIGYSTINGTGVTFYLTGTNSSYGSVNIGNGATVAMSAPSSGIYTGLLFFQDRAITSSVAATINGGVALKVTGGFYFPTTSVAFSNGSSSNGYAIAVVAKKVSFTGGTNYFTKDVTGLLTGLGSKSVGLMQ